MKYGREILYAVRAKVGQLPKSNVTDQVRKLLVQMTDTTHVRIYKSDKKAIEELAEDGSMPAKIRELIHKAEMYEMQSEVKQ